jgi:hypothetical protein
MYRAALAERKSEREQRENKTILVRSQIWENYIKKFMHIFRQEVTLEQGATTVSITTFTIMTLCKRAY